MSHRIVRFLAIGKNEENLSDLTEAVMRGKEALQDS
jgi:hypothetical protein